MFIVGRIFGYKNTYIGYNDSLLLIPVLFSPLGGREGMDWCEGHRMTFPFWETWLDLLELGSHSSLGAYLDTKTT